MKRRDLLAEFRELDGDALEERVEKTQNELMNLRFKHATGQLELTAQLQGLQRQIAQMKTVLRERDLAAQAE